MDAHPVRLFAWAHAMTSEEAAEAVSRFPGLLDRDNNLTGPGKKVLSVLEG